MLKWLLFASTVLSLPLISVGTEISDETVGFQAWHCPNSRASRYASRQRLPSVHVLEDAEMPEIMNAYLQKISSVDPSRGSRLQKLSKELEDKVVFADSSFSVPADRELRGRCHCVQLAVKDFVHDVYYVDLDLYQALTEDEKAQLFIDLASDQIPSRATASAPTPGKPDGESNDEEESVTGSEAPPRDEAAIHHCNLLKKRFNP